MATPRREKRVRPLADLWVFDRDSEDPIGLLADFTTQGLRLKSRAAIDLGVVLSCHIYVPIQVSTRGSVTFDARCVWCRTTSDPGIYEAGFELMNVVRGEMDRLKHLLSEEEARAGRSSTNR